MFEEENGYEVVHKMTESSEDLASLPTASGDTNQEVIESSSPVQASLFGESEDILSRDPSRKGWSIIFQLDFEIRRLTVWYIDLSCQVNINRVHKQRCKE